MGTILRYLVFGILVAFIVIGVVRPDLIMPTVGPQIEKAEDIIVDRINRPKPVDQPAEPASDPETDNDVEGISDPNAEIVVHGEVLPATLRDAGFKTAFAQRDPLPQYASITPEGAGAFAEESSLLGIIGGIQDDIALVPWLVGLRIHSEIILEGQQVIATETCGGGVYQRRWIVTAAHCLDSDYNVIEVIAGASNLDSPVAVRRVSRRAFIHAGYDASFLREDIGIIELAEPLPDYIPDAPWPTDEQARTIPQVQQVIGRGFGLNADGTADDGLKRVTLGVSENDLRVIRVASETDDVEGLCQGDSGTPIEAATENGNFIIGLVSFTEAVPGSANCSTPGFVAGLVSLEGYIDDIRKTVLLCTEAPEKCNG